MNEVKARTLAAEIKELCKRHDLWITVEEVHKPNLRMIKVKEISIKVENK